MNNFAQVNFSMGRKQGFTLAEVLITLAIIGVVAAMTIPTLMNSTNNQETVAKVQKTYATANQAFRRAELDNGPVDGWGWIGTGDGQGAINALNTLAPYLNVTKNCGSSSGCFPNLTYRYLNDTDNGNFDTSEVSARAQLVDGSLILLMSRSADCTEIRGTSKTLQNICGLIHFDVNGYNGPNQTGKDMFGFYITKYGVITMGTPEETKYPPSDCNKTQKGAACTAWILQQGNMDYLK